MCMVCDNLWSPNGLREHAPLLASSYRSGHSKVRSHIVRTRAEVPERPRVDCWTANELHQNILYLYVAGSPKSHLHLVRCVRRRSTLSTDGLFIDPHLCHSVRGQCSPGGPHFVSFFFARRVYQSSTMRSKAHTHLHLYLHQ